MLQAGDALAFDSSEPHLLVNEGAEPAEGIWFVLGRRLTPESHAARVAMPAERPVRVLHRGDGHLSAHDPDSARPHLTRDCCWRDLGLTPAQWER